MANSDKSNLKTIASIIKRQKTGAVFSIIVDNALYGLDKPKITFTIIQPEKEPARFFADIPEVMKLLNCAYRRRNGATEIFRSYKGGHDKKRNCIVARVLNVGVKLDNNGHEWFSFAVENCEGVQSYAENKYGQKVPGIVKPKQGGTQFSRNFITLTYDEFMYVIDSIKMELQAWRCAINYDLMKNPNDYRWHGNSNQQQPIPQNNAPQGGPPMMSDAVDEDLLY